MSKFEVEISEEEIKRLKKLAYRDHPTVNFDNPKNTYYGNFRVTDSNEDDDYSMGEYHESILNARYILNLLNIKWN